MRLSATKSRRRYASAQIALGGSGSADGVKKAESDSTRLGGAGSGSGGFLPHRASARMVASIDISAGGPPRSAVARGRPSSVGSRANSALGFGRGGSVRITDMVSFFWRV